VRELTPGFFWSRDPPSGIGPIDDIEQQEPWPAVMVTGCDPPMNPVSGAALRDLKARAQRLDPVLRIGKAGLSEAFYAALHEALDRHELVKVKFDHLKDQKKILIPQLVERAGAQLVLRVGNVAVLFRARPCPGDPPET
jgi:RNA-binding protein